MTGISLTLKDLHKELKSIEHSIIMFEVNDNDMILERTLKLIEAILIRLIELDLEK
jgi:hypothetical protein